MATYTAHIAGNLARPEGAPARFQLDESETGNIKVLAARLRQLRVLPRGMGLRSAVQLGHDWTVYPIQKAVQPIELNRTDLWTVIGRGKAGWHAARPDCSSSGGPLETIRGTRTIYPNGVWGDPAEEPWSRPGYVADAAEGCHVYDAEGADYDAFARHVISGPMLNLSLADDQADRFGRDDAAAARRMLPCLSGGFEVLAADAIAQFEAPTRTYSSLDRVGWGIYRGLLEKIGGVRFGAVRAGKVVWEEGPG